MSDHWSIVSGGESVNGDDDVSENGFTVVQQSTPPALKEPNLVQADTKPANEPITTELPMSNDFKVIAVKEWLSTSGVGASPQLLSTAKRCPEDKPKSKQEAENTVGKVIIEPKKHHIAKPTIPLIYTLKILDPQTLPVTKHGHRFTLRENPATWHHSVDTMVTKQGTESLILESLVDIEESKGKPGLLTVIMWSKIYAYDSPNPSFWSNTREAAYNKLAVDDCLVKLSLLPETTKFFRQRLVGHVAVLNLIKHLLEADEMYFRIKEGCGFEWASWEDGYNWCNTFRGPLNQIDQHSKLKSMSEPTCSPQ